MDKPDILEKTLSSVFAMAAAITYVGIQIIVFPFRLIWNILSEKTK